MNNFFITTHIGYATRGDSDEASSSGFLITRVPLTIKWSEVTAIGAIEDPSLFFDNDSVTEPISVLHTKIGSFHVLCTHAEAVKQWQAWEARQFSTRLTNN